MCGRRVDCGQRQTGAADVAHSAFSELLQRSVGVAEVRAMPVGDIALSQRLHRHDAQTLAEVLQAIKAHAQGVHQARELALALYDGYSPAQGPKRPLEGRSRADLPRYLRELTNDPEARQSLARVIEQGQAQAARLKSAPLRAAYTEALDAWEAGAGREALKRRLEIAQREKNRFFANRIAQTELARAHQASVAADLMADDGIDVVQVRINPAHPRTDICDFHARADLYGLGPGNYPKAKAPRPPFHPFCWCRLRSRPSLSAAGARPVPGAEAAYLRSMPADEAARVMGSRQRLQRVLDGASVVSVVNAGVDPLYRLARLGDPGVGHALVKNAGMRRDALQSWFESPAGNVTLFDLPEDLAAAVGAGPLAVQLSEQTLVKNRHRHPEIRDLDYLALVDADLADATVARDGDRALVFWTTDGGREMFAAIKVTESRKAAFLTSLRLSSERDVARVLRRATLVRKGKGRP